MYTALVLAAGHGRGAWPYGGVRQKTTLPVAQTPMVRRLVLQLKAVGVDHIVVVVGCGEGAVRACLADIAGLCFVRQASLSGCGDGVLTGLPKATGERVLVCCGDVVTSREALQALMTADTTANAEATLLGAPHVPGLAVWESIDTDGSGAVHGVWNKGDVQSPRFAGMVAGDAALLQRHLEQSPGYVDNVGVGAMTPSENSLPAALNRMCRAGHALRCVVTDAYVVDVNRPWDLVEANRVVNRAFFAANEGVVLGKGASIDDSVHIPGDATVHLGENAHIGRGVIVHGDVVLGPGARAVDGAILGARANMGAHSTAREYGRIHDDTVVGPRNLIGHCAEFAGLSLERTLLWHYCCVTAVVGAQVDIGAATCCGTWRFDDRVREQEVGLHRETPPYHGGMAFLGDQMRTGVNVLINPGVRIGGHSCIGPGVILYDDVPDGQLVLAEQKHVVKPWGPERYSW